MGCRPVTVKNTTEPADSGRTILFDSTCGFIETPSTGTGVGSYRGRYPGQWYRFRGTTLNTGQDVTLKMDYLLDGAWVNEADADLTCTASTTVPTPWDREPEAIDYRIYILAGGTAPTKHETVWAMIKDLEA